MPFVPDVPGVPPLLRNGDFVPTPSLMTSDGNIGAFGPTPAPRWGIFKNGQPIIIADSVVDFSYRQDTNISDYPVEDGGFQTYNKVETPFDVRIRFAMGGSDADHSAMLASIETIVDDLKLYDAVMPERIYQSMNVIHYDFQRRYDDGVGLLKMDVWLTEVRVTASQAFSSVDGTQLPSTKSPTSTSVVDEGTVQAQEPTLSQADAITRALQEQ